MSLPFGALAALPPPQTTALATLSPRVLRVRGLGYETLYCKRVEPAHATLPEAAELLRRETHILKQIAGSGAAVHAPEVVAAGEDGHGPYLLLAEVSGTPLDPEVARALVDPSDLVRSTFAALANLHDARTNDGPLNLVHGDISPENVLYTKFRSVFVDWELGRCTGVDDLPLDAFRGTLAYVAPEVAAGERATAASDVFALGLTLLVTLAGRPLRRQHGAAGLLEAAETPIALDDAFGTPAGAKVAGLRHFFSRVLAMTPEERPRDGGAALRLL